MNKSNFTKPKEAVAGTKGGKDLVKNHVDCLEELQDSVKNIENEINNNALIGEDTPFLAIKDSIFVIYTIKALLTDIVEE